MSKYTLRAKLALDRSGVDESHPQYETAKSAMAAYLEAQDDGIPVILESIGIKVDDAGKKKADSGRAKNSSLAANATKTIPGREEKYDSTEKSSKGKVAADNKERVDSKALAAHKSANAGRAKNSSLAKKEAKLKGLIEGLALDNLFLEHMDEIERTGGENLSEAREKFLEAHNYDAKLSEAMALIESIDAEYASILEESALIPSVSDLEDKANEAKDAAKSAAANVTKKADEIANLVGEKEQSEAELAALAAELSGAQETPKN